MPCNHQPQKTRFMALHSKKFWSNWLHSMVLILWANSLKLNALRKIRQ